MSISVALALLAQASSPPTVTISPPEEPSELERACLEKHGEEDEAALLDCLGIVDPRYAPVGEVEQAVPAMHPSQMYIFAARLFDEDQRPADALFWFYAGQLRWRTQMACNPPAPGGEGAAFGAMHETLGPQFNQYAAEDVDNWIGTIKRVLEWDEANPDPLLPEGCEGARAKQIEGLKKLAVNIDDRRAEIESSVRERRAEASVR